MAPAVPSEILAACYDKHGEPRQVVKVRKVPRPPAAGPGQLLVRVHAASLNPADWKTGKGGQAALLKFAWPRVYGFDFSGDVVEVGPPAQGQVNTFAIGDEVFGMIRGLPEAHRGTLAEYALVDADICARRPAGVAHIDCASLPLVAITAVKAFRACGLRDCPSEGKGAASSGPRVLITNGAGGVGSAALQIARSMFNASYVATTASAGPKAELCARLGAHKVVDYRSEDFAAVLASDDESQLFDAILDITDEAHKCAPLMKRGGGICSIAMGPTAEAIQTWMEEAQLDPSTVTVGVRAFLYSGCGSSLFDAFSGARTLRRASAARGGVFAHVIGTGDGRIMEAVADLMAKGKVQAVIDKVYPLSQAVEAIEYQAAGRAAGKVVLRVLDG